MTHASGNPKHIPVYLQADISKLPHADQGALRHLVSAVRAINPIYLEQMKQNFAKTNDIFDPSRGNNFYPEAFTRKELDAYLEEHPYRREALMSPFTVVARYGDALMAIPYSEMYRKKIKEVARALEAAANLVTHETFRNFLHGRANAFRTDSYIESDREWVQCVGSPLELIIGPFETYEDSILGVKRDFEATLGVVLPDEQEKIERYQELALAFDDFLGKKYGYTPFYTTTRMTVIDEVVTGGSTLYGFIAMAANLPDDEEIRRTVGSKKTFMRNVIEAKFQILTSPIAQKVLMETALDPKTFLQFIIGHELSHGLRFRFEGVHFGPLASPLEEAKADVFGVLFLYFLAQRGIVAREIAENAAIICIADGLREIRFNLKEAHAVGSLIKYRWLKDKGAIRFDGEKIFADRSILFEAFSTLGDELYKLTQTRNPKMAESFLQEWGAYFNQLTTILRSIEDLPVDIDPIFSI